MKTGKALYIAVIATMALLLATMPGAIFAQPKVTTAAEGTTVAEGLNGPQGVLVDDEGTVWVIDTGVGGDEMVPFFNTVSMEAIEAGLGDSAQIVTVASDGMQEVAAMVPSLVLNEQDLVGGGRLAVLDGQLYATVGQGSGDPESEGIDNFGGVSKVVDGVTELIASTWDFERENNPDGTSLHDSHPYGLAAGPDGMLYVADAGSNDLLRVDPASGEIELVAVFDPVPGVFPNETRGGEMVADPVPTGIAFDDDGNAYVSLLTGAPFLPGNAKVLKVTPDGEVSDYATGLTMLTDLRRGPDGELYAVQFVLFTPEGPKPESGSVFKLVEGDNQSELVISGLSFPTSIDFNADGDAYVSVNGGFAPPGTGAVLEFANLVTPAEPTEEMAAAAAASEEADEQEAEGDKADDAEAAEDDEADDSTMSEGENADDAAEAEGDKADDMAPENMPDTGGELTPTTTSISVVLLMLLALTGSVLFERRRHA